MDDRRYAGPINALLVTTLGAIARRRIGKWTWRLLVAPYAGVAVALRFETDGTASLRIARGNAPVTHYERARWESVVRELQLALGAREWTRLADSGSEGAEGVGISAVFSARAAIARTVGVDVASGGAL